MINKKYYILIFSFLLLYACSINQTKNKNYKKVVGKVTVSKLRIPLKSELIFLHKNKVIAKTNSTDKGYFSTYIKKKYLKKENKVIVLPLVENNYRYDTVLTTYPGSINVYLYNLKKDTIFWKYNDTNEINLNYKYVEINFEPEDIE